MLMFLSAGSDHRPPLLSPAEPAVVCLPIRVAPPGALSVGAPNSISATLVASAFANTPPSNPHSSAYSQAV